MKLLSTVIALSLLSTSALAQVNTNNGVGNVINNTSESSYNSNNRTNKQHQSQQATSSNSNNIAYNNRYPASSAFAAQLSAGGESCMGSTSAGAQAFSFGASIGSTWHDESCERRHDAITIYNMGEAKAALALMCQDKNIAKAMGAAGRHCVKYAEQEVLDTAPQYPEQPRR